MIISYSIIISNYFEVEHEHEVPIPAVLYVTHALDALKLSLSLSLDMLQFLFRKHHFDQKIIYFICHSVFPNFGSSSFSHGTCHVVMLWKMLDL